MIRESVVLYNIILFSVYARNKNYILSFKIKYIIKYYKIIMLYIIKGFASILTEV